MNDTIKTIFERRAIRKYKEKAVSKETIEQIIDAGRIAPSAMNRQPWKFYVVTSKEDIKLFSHEIAKQGLKTIPKIGIKEAVKSIVTGITNLSHGIDFLLSKDPVFHEAPVVIFITAPKDNEWAALDIGMCSQNMMLAAKSLGLDSCPIGFGKFVEKTKSYSKLNIPVDDRVQLAIIIGYGDEKPEVHTRKKDNVFYI
jgi:nitroreductase